MRSECLPAAQVPRVTSLYRDFVSYAPAIRRFFPSPPDTAQVLGRSGRHSGYESRRQSVADVLLRQNRRWGASDAVVANIDRLRQGASAVVTGQQVSLFGGPLFSIFKAISAIKNAREASEAGYPHVPVFWMATEDHDLAEIDHAIIPAEFGRLTRQAAEIAGGSGAPVGGLALPQSIATVLQNVTELLGDSEVLDILRESYAAGRTLGDACAMLLVRLFGPYGLIVIDASDPAFHEIGRPLLQQALQQAEPIARAIEGRNRELENAGYHAQVAFLEKSTLLFRVENGSRLAIRRQNSHFRAGARQFDPAELQADIEAHPECFSPNVLLRPVFQDYLLPTSAYVAGPAEVAYFAQAEVVYRALLGRVTPVIPRLSATLVEPRIQHWLGRYGLSVHDTFRDPEELAQRIAAQFLPAEVKRKLSAVGQVLHHEIEQLTAAAGKVDPTLVKAAQKSGSKMLYQMNRLRRLAASAELRKNAEIKRHAEALSTALYPNQNLQEREIAAVYFLARYGTHLIDQLLESTSTACTDHQIFYL